MQNYVRHLLALHCSKFEPNNLYHLGIISFVNPDVISMHDTVLCIYRLRSELKHLEQQRARLLDKLSKQSIFEEFLMQVMAASSEFMDIRSIISRYHTLQQLYEVDHSLSAFLVTTDTHSAQHQLSSESKIVPLTLSIISSKCESICSSVV